jgi:hypothetical protein
MRITGFRLVDGLLEDHADAAAAHAAHLHLGQRQHVFAVHAHIAGGDVAVVGQQAHQRQRRHALAAAGFADQRKGLATLRCVSRSAIDGAHQAGLGVELDFDVLDLEHGVHVSRFSSA